MTGVELRIDTAAAEAFVFNVERYLELDASDTEQFQEGLLRLAAASFTLQDLLRQAGTITEPMTDRAAKARTNNPYYTPTRAKAGRKP